MRKQPSPLEWRFADQEAASNNVWEATLLPTNSEEYPGTSTIPWRRYWSYDRWWRDGLLFAALIAILFWTQPWPHETQTTPITQPVSAPAPAATVVETTFFRFYVCRQDTPAVKLVALYIDQTYLALRRDFALAPPVGNNKLTIELGSATIHGSTGAYPDLVVSELFTPTGSLSAIGVEGAKLTVMTRLSEWLADHVLDEAIQQAHIKPLWWPEVAGLRHYLQLRQQDSNLWHYLATFSEPRRLVADLSRPTTFSDYVEIGEESPTRQGSLRFITATMFADYVVTTYGQQRLPALLDGFSRYDSWEELSLAVFGISTSRLETGWRAYLTQHIAVPPCRVQTIC